MVFGADSIDAMFNIKELIFFYPDFTVDSGISPAHALTRAWVVTTDRELRLAPRTLPRRYAI